MYTKNNLIAIYIVIGFYILFNLFYAKLFNILIFIAGFIIAKYFTSNVNALLIGCVMGMIFGIIKNFHLVENFEDKHNIEQKLKIINKALLDEYIRQNSDKVIGREVRISDLKPTMSQISSKKIKKLQKKPNNSNKILTITDDNYILDGHYEWYIHANNVFDNNQDKFVKCNIIKKDIHSFIEDITEFKHLVNKNKLDGIEVDRTQIEDAKNRITRIKEDLSVLEQHVDNFSKVAFV